jgi:hypothetical protein
LAFKNGTCGTTLRKPTIVVFAFGRSWVGRVLQL